ncbi:uncharacterized protein LOC121764369 [Salvia splendens]|uniref:uncharacterized protein LOC121764369 n=1 Tax=Salvia splendens TaxID=180675 RepID=UPI001C2793D5|nr:uncharacterized protein LOC121764369 [Salvia splendens]
MMQLMDDVEPTTITKGTVGEVTPSSHFSQIFPQPLDVLGGENGGCGEITSACSWNSFADGKFREEHNKSCVVLEIPKHVRPTGIRKITFKFSKPKDECDSDLSVKPLADDKFNEDLYDNQISLSAADGFHCFQNDDWIALENSKVKLGIVDGECLDPRSPSSCPPNMELRMSKKIIPNNYPSNVKKLLSTGILEGAWVKYLSMSGEELPGIIKSGGYLCGCCVCNFSKVVSSYEFEHHSGSKTRHPNNHIYLENGKPINSIIEELKNAPLSSVDTVIKAIAGSSLNEEYYQRWKGMICAKIRIDSNQHFIEISWRHCFLGTGTSYVCTAVDSDQSVFYMFNAALNSTRHIELFVEYSSVGNALIPPIVDHGVGSSTRFEPMSIDCGMNEQTDVADVGLNTQENVQEHADVDVVRGDLEDPELSSSSSDDILSDDSETGDSWEWFLDHVRIHVVQYEREVCIISDRHKGILKAMRSDEWKKPPICHHKFCLIHVRKNILTKLKGKGGKAKGMIWALGVTTQVRKYVRRRRALREESLIAIHELNKAKKENWSLCYDDELRWGVPSTNMSESYNNVLRGVRDLPIRALVDLTFWRTVEWWADRKTEIQQNRRQVITQRHPCLVDQRGHQQTALLCLCGRIWYPSQQIAALAGPIWKVVMIVTTRENDAIRPQAPDGLHIFQASLIHGHDVACGDSAHQYCGMSHSTNSARHSTEGITYPDAYLHSSVTTFNQQGYVEALVEQKHPVKKPRHNHSGSFWEHKKTTEGRNKKRDNDLHKLLFMPNGLPDGTSLAYYSKGKRILGGYKQGNGIVCSCCNFEISPSQFEAHAGWAAKRQPYRNIYTSSGLTLHDIALMLANGQSLPSSGSDDMCAVCGDGGELIICNGCPRAFHIACLDLECLTEDEWYCPHCKDRLSSGRKASAESRAIILRLKRVVKAPEFEPGGCIICRSQDFSAVKFDDRTVIICDQCEKEYHVGCLRESEMCDLKELPEDKWFCCDDCFKIFEALQTLASGEPEIIPAAVSSAVYKKHATIGLNYRYMNEIQWCILSGKSRAQGHLMLLSQAAAIFCECFDPIVAKSGRDLIPVMVYGRNISGQEFSGMYCVVLIVNSIVVSAALLRIFGKDVAELPLVATDRENQGKGYFQALFSCIERFLSSMTVKHLVLPAAEEAEPMWTNKLGFRKTSHEKRLKYTRDYQLTIFKGTSLLEKEVRP